MGRTARPFAPAVELGARIRDRRHRRGWSQARLAEISGLHATYISSVERGERNISLRAMLQLAGALGVDTGELLAGLSSLARRQG